MSDIKKAVMTDETAEKILQEMQIANATNRETRNLMSEQAAAMRGIYEEMANAAAEIYYVPVSRTESTENGEPKYVYGLSGISFEEVLLQYQNGKHLIVRIDVAQDRYIAPLSCYCEKVNNKGEDLKKLIFDVPCGPEGKGTLTITKNVDDGDVVLHMSPNGVADASQIACSVTIGETNCSTVQAALNAIATALS